LDVSVVRKQPGVLAVLTAADIPGENDASPVFHDDPVFAEQTVEYAGQSLFAVAADNDRGGACRLPLRPGGVRGSASSHRRRRRSCCQR
jgi:xanthine dehydrogenase molybdopterin-binding subunit B